MPRDKVPSHMYHKICTYQRDATTLYSLTIDRVQARIQDLREEGLLGGGRVCVLEHPRALLNTPLDWHHILLPPPYCCLSHYDSCPSPLPISLPPPLPPCITSLLTVPECVTQCTVEQTRKVFDQGTIFSVKMCGGLKYNVGICSCEYQSVVLQLVFLFCSDNVSYQCKSWSDILQGWSDMHQTCIFNTHVTVFNSTQCTLLIVQISVSCIC